MTSPFTLFETSWEVANKVGGIHTVLATKAKTLVERLGDRYVMVGPWRLGDPRKASVFEDERGFEGFCESCRALGVPVRVGRWKIPGRPRTVLVDASGLNATKDTILTSLWDRYRVDSLFGSWDYAEPALFGHAAGLVIERWHQEFVGPQQGEAVAQFHEWMTGVGLLHVKHRLPSVGTVFTTHATVLGRALGAMGQGPEEGLAGRTPDQAAEALNVRSKHSLEAVVAREADVLTTVSEVTAQEVEVFLGRRARPILVNGIDLEVQDALAGPTPASAAQAALRRLAERFLGEDLSDARIVVTSGRYEVHNKGLDVLVDALGRLQTQPGPRILFLALVPAGVSGIRRDLLDRLAAADLPAGALPGICTHNLFEGDADPLGKACAAAGLTNAPGTRVKVLHVADYLAEGDGLLNLPYEAALRGADFACFPSFYEPWGYTPLEALAAGVPAVTSDQAGFGQWAQANGLGPAEGVTVLARRFPSDAEAAAELMVVIARFLAAPLGAVPGPDVCRQSAASVSWSKVVVHYETAFRMALARAGDRALGSARPPRPRAPEAPPEGGPHFVPFEVAAALPEPLRGLERLARNLWWTWDPDAPSIFERLSPEGWAACRHNPVALLADVPAADLSVEASDPEFTTLVRRVVERFDAYVASGPSTLTSESPATASGSPWPPFVSPPPGAVAPSPERPVAYFCAEFGLHESLPIYSGGLGVLAGDHLKAASDLGLPLVAVGLFYRKGYLRQRVSVLGDQIPLGVENEPRDLPMDLVRDETGLPLRLELDLPGTRLVLGAWRVRVGRVPLYLLDADMPENRLEDRAITQQLYGGDQEQRLRQEIVLGKGGIRLLARLGIEPSVVHLNEGHAAFAPLERASRFVHEAGLTFDEAAEIVRATTVFTTHTPVPAGHDRFGEALMRRYFSDCAAWIGLPWERFFALGQAGTEVDFNMTYLGLRVSAVHNGVSRLHGRVSRRLLGVCWPGLLQEEVPVHSVTNGVHLGTWAAPAVARLVGAEGRPPSGADFSGRGEAIDLDALWSVRQEARRKLLLAVRDHLLAAADERHEGPGVIDRMLSGLFDGALLVGFARRFATYKRADLLLRDLRRLEQVVSKAHAPVRVFFAGKAHPQDKAGQDLLKKVVAATRSPLLIGKLYFLEDYDMGLARALVQGVDVWLNTPVRLMEASGTSGMKVAANGGLNVSIRDGWWDEAQDGRNGFSIGDGPIAATREIEDDLDAAALYPLLEDQVVPLFFDRDAKGVPRRWLERVRHSLATVPGVYDAGRMVGEYRSVGYGPLASQGLELTRDGFALARSLAQHHQRIRKAFASVRIPSHRIGGLAGLVAGSQVEVTADVDLAGLATHEVAVELVFRGPGAAQPSPAGTAATHPPPAAATTSHVAAVLEPLPGGTGSVRTFRATATVTNPGRFSGAVRVRARSDGVGDGSLADLVVWA